MRALLFLPLLVLSGCTNIIVVADDGGDHPDVAKPDAASSDSSAEGSTDSGPNDSGSDVLEDAAIDANDSGACINGTQACVDVWAVYCSRLKGCCNGNCLNAWQNQLQGSSICEQHFLGMSSATYCQQQRSNDTRCEQPCLGDLQTASCNTVINASYQMGVPSSVSSCQTFW